MNIFVDLSSFMLYRLYELFITSLTTWSIFVMVSFQGLVVCLCSCFVEKMSIFFGITAEDAQ